MATNEFWKIHNLEKSLVNAEVAPELVEQIMADGEKIRKTSPASEKTEWLREAMLRMDQLLPEEVRYEVRENCACCMGGKRAEVSKGIFKQGATFEERVAIANKTPFVFGHSVATQDDGRVLVSFFPEGQESYNCVCLPNAGQPFSITYCYCCGGHVKHHLQRALGEPLDLEVRSSALASGGSQGCTFLLTRKGAE